MLPPTRTPVPLPVWFDGRGPDADIVVSTRVRVVRNLTGHRFIPHASAQERSIIFEKVTGLLKAQHAFKSLTFVNFSGISRIEQQLLAEKRVASSSLCCCEGDRGVAYDRRYRVNIMINAKDHLCFHCLDSGFRPEEMWKLARSNEERFGRNLDFAYSRQRGFLTCRPVDSGAGLRISFLLHLPGLALTRSIDMVLQGANQMGFRVRGFFEGHQGVTGNLFMLVTTAATGLDEVDLIENTRRVIAEVVRSEHEARRRLVREARLELTDRIYRAYGILRYARSLSIGEFLNLSSALRLGYDTGLFNGIAIAALNRSMFLVMPAHLQNSVRRTLHETECGVARAEFARSLFSNERRRNAVKRGIPE
jgi:protein arginine kinase